MSTVRFSLGIQAQSLTFERQNAMNVTNEKEKIIINALDSWLAEGLITEREYQKFFRTLAPYPFNLSTLSHYISTGALLCLTASIGIVASDAELLSFVYTHIMTTITTSIFIPAVVSLTLYLLAIWLRTRDHGCSALSGFILGTGAIMTGISLWQTGKWLELGKGAMATQILTAGVVWGLVGFFARSCLLWFLFLLSLCVWFGVQTGYDEGWSAY
ncbi:hypothetical protein [Enterobacter vonholyi]